MTQKEARVLIGSRIREARKRRGMKQSELAAKLYMCQSLLSGTERGLHPIDVAMVKSLSEILKVSILYLLGYPEEVCVLAEKQIFMD